MKEEREEGMPFWIEQQEMRDDVLTLRGDTFLVSENLTKFEANRRPNELVVPIIMGPSGSGKDSLVDALDSERFARVKTFTTRPRGRYETEENDVYIRGSEEDVNALVAKNSFLEGPVTYDGNQYGMVREVVEEALGLGKIPVFRLEPNGINRLKQLKESGEPLFENMNFWVIFVCPPEKYEWIRRLVARDVLSQTGEDRMKMRAKTKKRWLQAQKDLEWMSQADEILVNDDGREKLEWLARAVEWRIDWWNS